MSVTKKFFLLIFSVLVLFLYGVVSHLFFPKHQAFVEPLVAAQEKTKVLIVVGHDDDVWGAQYMGVKEVELNRMLATHIYNLLKDDPLFDPTITQVGNDYIPELKNFLETEEERIEAFRKERRETYRLGQQQRGELENNGEVVHNPVTEEVATILYGVNVWATERGFDLLLHIHFNDYPGRPRTGAGKYSGFSIYVPDEELINGKESATIGKHLYDQFIAFGQIPSNLPVEENGFVSTDELIAVGARNSLPIPSVLIEYGYIAEPRFQGRGREVVLQEMAKQTHAALRGFFQALP